MTPYQYTETLLQTILSRRSFLLLDQMNIKQYQPQAKLPEDCTTEADRHLHLESLFCADMIDELRCASQRWGMNMAHIDFGCISFLLDTAARSYDFEPTTSNLVTALRAGLDETCEYLLKGGAQLPDSPSDLLCELFMTKNMHLTIAYLIEHRLIPVHVLAIQHLTAAIDSPYITLVRILASRQLIKRQFKQLPLSVQRDYNLRFFYWQTRAVVLGDIGAEQVTLLSKHFDLSLFDEATFVAMLRHFGDCWSEFGNKNIKKIQSDDDNSFAPFRVLRGLVLSFEDQPMKGRYAQFYLLAGMILGSVYQTNSERLMNLLALDTSNDSDRFDVFDGYHFDEWFLSESSAA